MARHAICDKNGLVVNVIIWDGAEFVPARGYYVIQNDTVEVDDVYDFANKVFIKPDRTGSDPEPTDPEV